MKAVAKANGSSTETVHKIEQRRPGENLLQRLLLCSLILISAHAQGQENISLPGAERIADAMTKGVGQKLSEVNPTGETIDLNTGSLGFRHVDLLLEGAGPPIEVARTWSVSKNSTNYNFMGHTGAIQDWELDVPAIETMLLLTTSTESRWKVQGTNPFARCSNFGYPAYEFPPKFWWRGATLYVPGLGSQMLLRRNGDYTFAPGNQPASYPVVTIGNWAFSCLTQTKNTDGGEGFLGLAPDGSKYWFDWYTEENFGDVGAYYTSPIPAGPQPPNDLRISGELSVRLKVSRVEDRHGNYLQYEYAGRDLVKISASDGRFVDFDYETVNAGTQYAYTRLTTLSYSDGASGLRQIHYGYETWRLESPVRNYRSLNQVTLADGSKWLIDLKYANNLCRYRSPINQDAYRLDCHPTNDYSGSTFKETATITTPSSLRATYVVGTGRVERWAENCPLLANGDSAPNCMTYPIEPSKSAAFRLQRKTYEGPGLTPMQWSYRYIRSGSTPSTVQTNPDGTKDVYVFRVFDKYLADEGKLLTHFTDAQMVDDSVASAKRKVEYTYAMGRRIGTAVPYFVNHEQTERFSAIAKTVTTQESTVFVSEVSSWDSYLRPITSVQSNAVYSRIESNEYEDNVAHWVLGQNKRSLLGGVETTKVEYDALAMPWKVYSFGRLQKTHIYDYLSHVTTGQRGAVTSIADGNGKVTRFADWKRRIPQLTILPDGSQQRAVVNDLGEIVESVNEAGAKTCYRYDAMSRLIRTTYPSETTVGKCDANWEETLQSFAPSSVARYGLPAGYWIQILDTGRARTVRHFDAMWRPVLEEVFDNTSNTTIANTHSMTVKRYDYSGNVVFQSYPVRSLTSVNEASLKGVRTSYDSLSRETKSAYDSEFATPLETTTEYLPGARVRSTNPRGYVTTIDYLTYDQPMHSWPVRIEHPQGVITQIGRDVWGKPTSIVRRGGVSDPVLSRYYVYDGYQQLCKVVEPEAGVTVMDYDAAGLMVGSASGLALSSLADCSTATAMASGRWVTRTYDARQRLSTLSFPDGQGSQRWYYWPNGQVKQVNTLNNGIYTYNSYTYFQRGLPNSEALARADGATWMLNYGYDANANLASIRYPNGQTVEYAPNALGQPTRAGTYVTEVSYHANGAIKQFTYGNGIVHALSQNARQLPDVSQDAYGGYAFLQDGYDYDQNGNVAAISDGAAGRNQRGNRTMVYDGLDRLTRADSPMFGTSQYGYDVLDNLTHVVAPERDQYYCYDTLWRLTNVKTGGCNGTSVVGLGYDAQGNLSNRNGTLYKFDYGNRLREVKSYESYQYDAYGRRTQSMQTSGSLLSFYDQNGVLRSQEDQRTRKATDYISLGGSLVAEVERPAPLAVHNRTYVNWAVVPNATRYFVEESVDGLTWTSVYEGQAPSWTSLDRPSAGYTYRILSCNSSGVCTAVGNFTVKHQASNPMQLLHQLLLSP